MEQTKINMEEEKEQMIIDGLKLATSEFAIGSHGAYMSRLLCNYMTCEGGDEEELDQFSLISDLSLTKTEKDLGINEDEYYDGISLMNTYAMRKAEVESESIPDNEWTEFYEKSQKKHFNFAMAVYFGNLYDAMNEVLKRHN